MSDYRDALEAAAKEAENYAECHELTHGAAYLAGIAIADRIRSLPEPNVAETREKNGMVRVPIKVVEFLNGSKALDGIWFGDHRNGIWFADRTKYRGGKPPFWWRRYLRAAIDAAKGKK